MRAEVLDDPSDLGRIAREWDDLVVASARPMSSPAWLLAWWKHLAPARSSLRVVAVRDADGLAAVLPLIAVRRLAAPTEYRLVGGAHRADPLIRDAGDEEGVVAAVAAALAGVRPPLRILRLRSIDAASPWPRALVKTWPGDTPPRVRRGPSVSAPTIDLTGGSFDLWMAGKSANFRQTTRRRWRRLVERGASLRMSTADDMDRDAASFARLHLARWGMRSNLSAGISGVEGMIAAAGRTLAADHRLRLWCMDIDGETVASQLFLAAGGEVAFWGGGWDPRLAEMNPGLQVIVGAVEDAFGRGDHRMDLGGGAQPYKLRIADGDAPLVEVSVMPRGSALPLVLAGDRLTAERLRSDARVFYNRLPAETRAQVKRLAGRDHPVGH